MAQHEKIPYIDVDEMHEQIVEFYDAHARPETLFAILNVYQEHAELLAEIEEKMFEHRDSEAFEKWRKNLHSFSDRIQWYAEAVDGADSPMDAYELISPPLFDGEYPEGLETTGDGPDNQAVWKLANELSVIGDPRDLSEASLEEMREHYKTFVEVFWKSIAEEVGPYSSEMPDDERADAEAAMEAADKLAREQPEEVVVLRTKGAGEGRRSIAPLLLAAGAIFMMSKRKGRH